LVINKEQIKNNWGWKWKKLWTAWKKLWTASLNSEFTSS